jgi:DNA ligase-1
MLFREICEILQQIEGKSGRLEITSILANMYKAMSPSEAEKISYLLQGKLRAEYYGVEFGVGEKFVIAALATATGYSEKEISALYVKKGDIGIAASELTGGKKQKSLSSRDLSLEDVYNSFMRIAQASGTGSQGQKIRFLSEMFNSTTPIEAKYIARIVLNKLRIKVGDATVLDALSWSSTGDKTLREKLERAYNLCSDLGLVAKTLFEDPKGIARFKIKVFRPLRPALAERLNNAEQIFEKLEKCAVEYKYDGFRMQVHKKGKEVRIYSRKLETMEHMFPDVVESVKKLPQDEIVFEGEALAFNEKESRFYSFQETMHRRRKYGLDQASKDWPLHIFVFDIMSLNGEDCTAMKMRERRKLIEGIFPFGDNLKLSEWRMAKSADDIQKAFDEATGKRLEGIIAKNLEAPYTAGKRDFAWIKLKKSYGKAIDTIDAVIMGYYFGKGSRTKFGIGGLLCAVYNEDRDAFETVAKVGSGFTEEEMANFREMLEAEKAKEPPKNLSHELKPDVWVEPKHVAEIAFDDITISSQHTCMQRNGRGYALRFPRFVKLREDKGIYEASTAAEVENIFKLMKGMRK